MIQCTVLSLFTVVELVSASAINYCNSKICGSEFMHTFCQYSPGPSPSCVGYVEAPLTLAEREAVLSRMNRRRGEAARGLIKGLPPAADMLKLRWVDELAREAQLWAEQCQPISKPEIQDACRDLYSVPVGQCVASIAGDAPGLRPESLVDVWHLQSLRGPHFYYAPPETSDRNTADFAQLVWSSTYMVGCGRSRFLSTHRGGVRAVERLVCNFAPRGCVPGKRLWSPGEPASDCPEYATPDVESPGLCSYQLTPQIKNNENLSSILLQTVLEVENNKSFNYIGSFDEIFLIKTAIAKMLYNNEITTINKEIKNISESLNVTVESNAVENIERIPMFDNLSKENLIEDLRQKKELPPADKIKVYDELNDINVGVGDNYNNFRKISSNLPNEQYSDYDFKRQRFDKIKNNYVYPDDTVDSNSIQSYETLPTKYKVNSVLNRHLRNYDSNYEHERLKYSRPIPKEPSNHLRRTEEDYLSDPETAQQLQEALDKMERELSQTVDQTSNKVRRELRNLSADMIQQEDETNPEVKNEHFVVHLQPSPIESQTGAIFQDENGNKTTDAPVLDMLLRYMPYLHNYENPIIGIHKKNEAVCAVSSITNVILLYLCI